MMINNAKQNHHSIIIAGGGPAGVAAAIAAARNGSSVLLIEKGNCLGGAAAMNLVNPFMKYWTMMGHEKKYLSRGIFEEICDELKEAGAIDKGGTCFDEEYLKLILNRMALKSGVQLLFNTTLIGVEKENTRIAAVNVYNKTGMQSLTADYFIDATGDGDLMHLAGVPYRLGRKSDSLCQPMTLCFRIGNIDMEETESDYRQQIQKVYLKYKEEGLTDNPREDVLIFNTLTKGILHFNTTRIVKMNPVDGYDVSQAEIKAREQAYDIYHMLKKEIKGFENSVMLMTAASIGTRESRMLEGMHVLTEEELKACKKFDDSIALGNYDIDIHNPEGSGTSHYYFKDGEYYSIPYASLVPKENGDNLLVAGRCISATHEGQASIRIMPICYCLGEAAGTAAAIAAETGTRKLADIDIKKLQKRLTEQGAAI